MTNENCCKCDSVVEDGICCPSCQSFVHPKCAGFTKDSLSLYKKMKNLRWYCDNCLSYVDDVKGISKLINDKHVALDMELKKISESGDILRNDIEQLRIAVDNSKGKLDQVASVDSLKSEINAKWSEVLVMNKLFKIKLLDDKLKSIRISHDMTREQRTDYRKLVDEAKSKEADDGEDFLYRVRGPVGRWKIVRFLKKGK
ncbi:hypothetical protein HELRODRAFT_158657 [Helobdella robusta]|uniref:Zinc finger PHD-type domain-containing protein n=1 Tax=Helobdella robusta TaxID=6412 RepID=T1EN35_HELRO|nr:hypothetical protein HELRODRAFT_158657 [Helobdella robusta]ESO12193.1 hypothetical protein HELRODRAFT_158657 [Helobdella robusta]